ncbi:MAG: M24 family metallopeptidase [Steroidobacteraceae bacterium]|jgi:Xaa-Pro aminopeptidase
MDPIAKSLWAAQEKAATLFSQIVDEGLIQSGRLESELTEEIYQLALKRFGVKRHWHDRIVRSGPNTLMGYYDQVEDRRITEDDIVYLDFGPVFESWEADFGRSFALGPDPLKHRLVRDIGSAFERGKQFFRETPDLTAGALYDFVAGLAAPAGWEFGALTAGHLIGHFPHEKNPPNTKLYSIRSGNSLSLREPDSNGRTRHWILEIHFIDRAKQIGGFFEELLTVDAPVTT